MGTLSESLSDLSFAGVEDAITNRSCCPAFAILAGNMVVGSSCDIRVADNLHILLQKSSRGNLLRVRRI